MNSSRSVENLGSRYKVRGNARGGFSLIEQIVAAALLAAVMVTLIPLLVLVGQECRTTEQRQAAMMEVENLMDRLTAQSWDELTDESVERVELSDHLRQRLKDPSLVIKVQAVDDNAKRIRIEMTWKHRSGQFHSPVRLSAWTYR